MPAVKIFVILMMAVRIWIYMRCFYLCTRPHVENSRFAACGLRGRVGRKTFPTRLCIGKYRVPKRLVIAAFTMLWIVEGFCVSISYIGQGSTEMDLFFFLIEMPFLFVISFCYRGKILQRLLMAVILPFVYWIGKWSIGFAIFKTISNSRQYVIVTAVAIFLLCILELILEKAGKSRQEREQERLEQEILIYENQFDIIRQSQYNIRALKHDMKHHIKMLTDLIAEGETDPALEYLASMGAFMENREEYVATGNERIDSILNYMISRAKKSEIDISWKVQLPEQLEIPVFDINVILSNLFENAFNALEEVIEPSLQIVMRYDRGILCINTKNKCSNKERQSGSSKGHGIGLKNVRRIAEKYHGNLTVAARDGEFDASVLLFLEDADTK